MPGICYGVIDDEGFNGGIEDILDSLVDIGGLRFQHIPPEPYTKLFPVLQSSRVDGLIVDLRLDLRRPQVGQETLPKADYRGSSLAQEIRTRSIERGTERAALRVPIVLWSATSKLRNSFAEDSTSYDLFDRVYDKVDMLNDVERTAAELVALSNGYKRMRHLHPKGRSGLLDLLDADEFVQSSLEPVFGEQFQDRIQYPPHQYSQFIISEILEVPGLLIDEAHLAARLGVDRASHDWPALLKMLHSCAYEGIYCDGWARWWMPLVNRWWRKQVRALVPLRRANAAERLEVIRSTTKLKRLKAPQATRNSNTAYWFIDSVSQEPIAVSDAVRIRKPKPFSKIMRAFDYSWQDGFYISRQNVEDQTYKEFGFTLHPSAMLSA